MSKRIALFNHKGGTGKHWTAFGALERAKASFEG